MPAPKKAKAANDATPATPFLSSLWNQAFGLANDTRCELHKQVGAVIGLADGLSKGLIGYAHNLNDRADKLSAEGLAAAENGAPELIDAARGFVTSLAASYKSSSAKLVGTTRETARAAVGRAADSAKALLASDTRAADEPETKKAA